MSKQKIFIYLLSTTLIVPTFTSDIAHATELTNQSHNESNHASVDKSDNDDTSDTNDEQTTKKQEKSAKTTKFKQYTRAKKLPMMKMTYLYLISSFPTILYLQII